MIAVPKQYIVSQEPKSQFREGHVVFVAVVQATSKRAAIDKVAGHMASHDSYFFKRPRAEILTEETVYRL